MNKNSLRMNKLNMNGNFKLYSILSGNNKRNNLKIILFIDFKIDKNSNFKIYVIFNQFCFLRVFKTIFVKTRL